MWSIMVGLLTGLLMLQVVVMAMSQEEELIPPPPDASKRWIGEGLDPNRYCSKLFKTPTGSCPPLDRVITGDVNNDDKTFPNLIQMDGAYCYNDGSGKCKAFSSRFEYYFNTRTGDYLGPVEASEFVNSYGLHSRVPISYDINGNIVYADRSINWSRAYVKNVLQGKKLRLLSMNSFNWCEFVQENFWPYKSAIKDPTGQYHIYFFNRQSCIIKGNDRQHYNTRFMHNSSLRLDLDINPTIFTVEDHLANNEIRLVKHKRQHWYEVPFQVIENPTPTIKYFVKMSPTEREPSLINATSGPIINSAMFRKVTNVCIEDKFQKRVTVGNKNSHLLASQCGYDETEIADMPYCEKRQIDDLKKERGMPYTVGLHGIPRWPRRIESFWGVTTEDEKNWMEFAHDGLTFTATTSIPKELNENTWGEKNTIISLYAKFVKAKDDYDENYPTPHISIHNATLNDWNNWKITDRPQYERKELSLNQVDDIAYLHKCLTVLVIFGPLYTEQPFEKFSINYESQIGSIYDLGIWERANAFFAEPMTNNLWVYHQMNYMALHVYACGTDGKLVTAKKSQNYLYRISPENQKISLLGLSYAVPKNFDQTSHFRLLGLLNQTFKPDAPDPALYPLETVAPEPMSLDDNTWIYVLVGIAILIVLALCIICLATLRRRHKKGMPIMESFFSMFPTTRSNMPSNTGTSRATARSGLPSLDKSRSRSRSASVRSGSSNSRVASRRNSASPTIRTHIPSSRATSGTRASPSRTRRSDMTAKGGGSASSGGSHRSGRSRTRRSGMTK